MRTLLLLLAAGGIGLTAAAAPAAAHRGLQMFNRADTDKDGKITKAEFDAARNARFAGIDANGDGALEISELRAWGRAWPSRFRDARFKALDGDSNGKIGVEEYVAQRKAMFAMIDANKDGTVDKAEFDAAFEKFRSRMQGRRMYRRDMDRKRAHGGPKAPGHRLERRLDLNGDGKVTRTEFATVDQMTFLRLDRDGDGAVSRDEVRIAHRRFRRHGGER